MTCPIHQKFVSLARAVAAAGQCREEGQGVHVVSDLKKSSGVRDVFVLVNGNSPVFPTRNEYADYQNALTAARNIGGIVQTLCADEVLLCVHRVVKK